MKRDMELIRTILLAVESYEPDDDPLTFDGYSEEQVGFHCYLLGEAGLAEVMDATSLGDPTPMAEIRHLTWQGYEFLDAARDDTVWNQAKERLGSAGKSLLSVPLGVMTALLIDEAKRRLGMIP
ncbi:MAG: hypothetical protein C0485_01810 [Pirellula sp.]|nr:hypothetical protein [Pirellula sp.]